MNSLRDDPSNPRWLRKALREIPREIGRVVERFDEPALRWRPAPGEWSALEVLGWLAESEREDTRAVEAMVREDGARIEEQRAHLAPLERDFNASSGWRLYEDFARQREELLWSLEFLGAEWQHTGTHPYRGPISLMRYLREMSDRDLEASIMLRKLQEASGTEFEAVGGRRSR
jgi:hypothetical protein